MISIVGPKKGATSTPLKLLAVDKGIDIGHRKTTRLDHSLLLLHPGIFAYKLAFLGCWDALVLAKNLFHASLQPNECGRNPGVPQEAKPRAHASMRGLGKFTCGHWRSQRVSHEGVRIMYKSDLVQIKSVPKRTLYILTHFLVACFSLLVKFKPL